MRKSLLITMLCLGACSGVGQRPKPAYAERASVTGQDTLVEGHRLSPEEAQAFYRNRHADDSVALMDQALKSLALSKELSASEGTALAAGVAVQMVTGKGVRDDRSRLPRQQEDYSRALEEIHQAADAYNKLVEQQKEKP
jgi:hypothetical protein